MAVEENGAHTRGDRVDLIIRNARLANRPLSEALDIVSIILAVPLIVSLAVLPKTSLIFPAPLRGCGGTGDRRGDPRRRVPSLARPGLVTIRQFENDDFPQVRELFIVVNRLLSPAQLRDAFEAYIERALAEEIDRITAYYGQRDGGFWVAIQKDKVVGTFGLERASPDSMELRRMYVDPRARRHRIARQMLRFAEDECRRREILRLELSTSELQEAALAFYRNSGYRLVREDLAQIGSNKTVGAGLRRFYFKKCL